MAEYIEREAAINEQKRFCGYLDNDMLNRLEIATRRIPAADVRPVVRGFNKLKDYPSLFECSVCGWECGDTVPGDTETYNYCPNCGAEMEKS